MHTPAKGAGPNKGLGGSNPPFSAKTQTPKSLRLRGFSLIPLIVCPAEIRHSTLRGWKPSRHNADLGRLIVIYCSLWNL